MSLHVDKNIDNLVSALHVRRVLHLGNLNGICSSLWIVGTWRCLSTGACQILTIHWTCDLHGLLNSSHDENGLCNTTGMFIALSMNWV